jgi:hypothetical protein
MKVIWKQQLNLAAEPQDVPMNAHAEIVHVDKQDGVLTLWYLHDPSAILHATRRFQLFGTGHVEIPDDATFLGTVFHGWLVLHLFELPVVDG